MTLALSILLGLGLALVLLVWGRAARRAATGEEDFDLTRLNILADFPYNFPLTIPFWRLRTREKPGRQSQPERR